ncbi:unnamed protein product [Aspergillus oryzae]|uniref:Unnamed protein product n=2 Tax=Aspergillus oryzae TaxID=5062 RepID=A0AAN5BZ73_ASPOZ|nr:unnamed protein product [Aspergillus oryzae]GMF91293.1 unnamed protein product [Aspergillus oryzae]GMG12407.1 unnamed protein product [Aspergillus oryzae]GMG31210.1 unnamed protein product [Aspergillus oryzae]GMG50603.1 unnamed protein product [Aspergillus oryzae var. brunneus]
MKSFIASLFAASLAYAQTATESEPSLSDIEKAAATTEPYSPVSNVTGLAFDRFFQVWLENIVCGAPRILSSLHSNAYLSKDYSDASADENYQWLAKQGITL